MYREYLHLTNSWHSSTSNVIMCIHDHEWLRLKNRNNDFKRGLVKLFSENGLAEDINTDADAIRGVVTECLQDCARTVKKNKENAVRLVFERNWH